MFGKRLSEIREKRGLSQYDLADRTGFSRGRIANYERGTREPDFETAKKLADALGTTAAYLFGETDDPAAPEEKELTAIYIKETLESNNLKMYRDGFDWESFEKLDAQEQETLLKMFNDNIRTFLQLKEMRNK